jgi:hypothetical protein
MSAEIIQFIPKPNPNRPTLTEAEEIEAAEFLMRSLALLGTTTPGTTVPSEQFYKEFGGRPSTDCGNIGWPWPGEDKA